MCCQSGLLTALCPRHLAVVPCTGQCLSRENLQELIKFAHEERIVLMADEVYQVRAKEVLLVLHVAEQSRAICSTGVRRATWGSKWHDLRGLDMHLMLLCCCFLIPCAGERVPGRAPLPERPQGYVRDGRALPLGCGDRVLPHRVQGEQAQHSAVGGGCHPCRGLQCFSSWFRITGIPRCTYAGCWGHVARLLITTYINT